MSLSCLLYEIYMCFEFKGVYFVLLLKLSKRLIKSLKFPMSFTSARPGSHKVQPKIYKKIILTYLGTSYPNTKDASTDQFPYPWPKHMNNFKKLENDQKLE